MNMSDPNSLLHVVSTIFVSDIPVSSDNDLEIGGLSSHINKGGIDEEEKIEVQEV